jgi:hypothetical protein
LGRVCSFATRVRSRVSHLPMGFVVFAGTSIAMVEIVVVATDS